VPIFAVPIVHHQLVPRAGLTEHGRCDMLARATLEVMRLPRASFGATFRFVSPAHPMHISIEYCTV
jgi:hypothetical protein